MNTGNKTKAVGIGQNSSIRRASALALGNFDGFHLGHREIIDTLKAIAISRDLVSIILTFNPNPKIYFNRQNGLILTQEQKKRILAEQGVDHVIILDFAEIVDMSDEAFLKEFLIEKYHMKHIVMGENFRFGKGREGDITFLKEASRRFDFEFSVVKSVMLENHRVSSTYIREQLADGEIEITNRMLGRIYSIEGVVAEGDKVGRHLGFPTINVDTENTMLPEGVYKTTVEIENDERRYDSITYIGYRPTFMGKEKKVESHIFDFDRKIYGMMVRLYFEKKLRGEMRFDSPKSLLVQIKKDIEDLKVDKGCIF
jgi:riboflavin kinase/FMN adenylyltransferase